MVVQSRLLGPDAIHLKTSQQRTKTLCNLLPRNVLRNGFLRLLVSDIGDVQQRHVARCEVVDLTGVSRERGEPGVQVNDSDVSNTHVREEVRDCGAVVRVEADLSLGFPEHVDRLCLRVRHRECVTPQPRRRSLEGADVIIEDHNSTGPGGHGTAAVLEHAFRTAERHRGDGQCILERVGHFGVASTCTCVASVTAVGSEDPDDDRNENEQHAKRAERSQVLPCHIGLPS